MTTSLELEKPKHRKDLIIRSELNVEKWAILFATSKFRGKSREVYRHVREARVGVIVGKQKDDQGNVIEVGILRVPDLKVFYGLIKVVGARGQTRG